MDDDKLSLPTVASPRPPQHHRRRRTGFLALLAILASAHFFLLSHTTDTSAASVPIHAQATLARCRVLSDTPGPAFDFHRREASDRFVPGTKPTLIRNARIWTGADNGTEVLKGDIYLNKGIIRGVGHLGRLTQELLLRDEIDVVDVKGAWVTPGIVDPHSHLGDASSPALDGASGDDNSIKGPILPWMRSLDGLNTHDDSYALSIAGGVTTALVLPGSANAIGGQAFTIKLRKTAERSPTAMLLEPPHDINGTRNAAGPLRWRQMKHACGENPSRVYDGTRMDTFWAFRQAYDKARQIKVQQDAYCDRALAGQWSELGDFPDDLQWEALVDVLRGRVRVQTHCYEAVDLDDLIRLSNEFKFPIAAVHHASEAYLVPDVLKKAYGHPPAVALFATNGRYKREAYRASAFAPRILSQNGLKVVMKSDHPVLNSRYLLYEAQQAHYYGLAENLAIAAVTSHAAQVIGMDHRIGYVQEGWDADLVVWDSHPLALGATPAQVYIDGIPQLDAPFVVRKPSAYQASPLTPNFDKEAADALKYEGLPPLLPTEAEAGVVLFTNVSSVVAREGSELREMFASQSAGETGVVLVKNGKVLCYGAQSSCAVADHHEIDQEPSTGDGYVYDPLTGTTPKILDDAVVRAVDGLQFAGRSALLAYRAGVTRGISAPSHRRFFGGFGAAFSLGARHRLEGGAVVQEETALHVAVRHFGSTPSVSTQIATLRRLLLAWPEDDDASGTGMAARFAAVAQGKFRIVVEAESADVIATLIVLKREVEEKTGARIQMTIAGATEAHLLARELAEAKIGVVLVPSRPFPATWEQKRILPGPPLSKESAISLLLGHGVTVGIGIEESWSAQNTRFDVAWAALEADGRISKTQALALASTDLEKLLGIDDGGWSSDLVATAGGDLLQFESKVVAVISPGRRVVDLF